jgi:hypothetical protein
MVQFMTEEQKAYLRHSRIWVLKQIREFAMARCAPFFWSSQESDNRRSCGTTGPSRTSAPASEISR